MCQMFRHKTKALSFKLHTEGCVLHLFRYLTARDSHASRQFFKIACDIDTVYVTLLSFQSLLAR